MFAMLIGESDGVREIVTTACFVINDRILLSLSMAGGSSSSVGGMARSSSLRRRAELLATKRSSAVEPSSQVICFIKPLTDMKIRNTEKQPYYRNILCSFIDVKKFSRAPIRKWLAAEAQVIPIRYAHLHFFSFLPIFPWDCE